MEPFADSLTNAPSTASQRDEEAVRLAAEQRAAERETAEALAAVEDARGQAMAACREAEADGNGELADEARAAIELCKKAELEIKANRGQRRSGGREYGQIVKDVRGAVSGVTEHVAEDGPEDNPKSSTLRTLHAQQAETKAAKNTFLGISLPSKPRDANEIIVTARRQPKQIAHEESDYVGSGSARRLRKTQHTVTKGAAGALTAVTFGLINDDTADEVVSTVATAAETSFTGAGAIFVGDGKGADKAAQAMGRGVRNVIRDDLKIDAAFDYVGETLGTDQYLGKSAVGETLGKATHTVLWAGGRAGTAVSQTVQAGGAAVASAWNYMTGSEAKAATPAKPGLSKFELEVAQATGLDKNKDGRFDGQETAAAKALARKLNAMGVTMANADKDHNGDISAVELGNAIRAAKAKAQKQH